MAEENLDDIPQVNADEILWRSIDPQYINSDDEDGLILSSQAFNDSAKKPSVDRKLLKPNPVDAKRAENHGIIPLSVQDIQSVVVVGKASKAKENDKIYKADVVKDPIFKTGNVNIAHALIVSAPEITTQGMFKRLKTGLKRVAEKKKWAVKPS